MFLHNEVSSLHMLVSFLLFFFPLFFLVLDICTDCIYGVDRFLFHKKRDDKAKDWNGKRFLFCFSLFCLVFHVLRLPLAATDIVMQDWSS